MKTEYFSLITSDNQFDCTFWVSAAKIRPGGSTVLSPQMHERSAITHDYYLDELAGSAFVCIEAY